MPTMYLRRPAIATNTYHPIATNTYHPQVQGAQHTEGVQRQAERWCMRRMPDVELLARMSHARR